MSQGLGGAPGSIRAPCEFGRHLRLSYGTILAVLGQGMQRRSAQGYRALKCGETFRLLKGPSEGKMRRIVTCEFGRSRVEPESVSQSRKSEFLGPS